MICRLKYTLFAQMTSCTWAWGEQSDYGKGFTYGISFIGTRIFFAYINEATWFNMDSGLLEGSYYRRSVLDAAHPNEPRIHPAAYISDQQRDGPYRRLPAELEGRAAPPTHLLGFGCCQVA